MLATLMAAVAPRRVWPTSRPIGRAIAIASRRATAETSTWARTTVGMPSGPCQFAGWFSQAIVASISSIGRAPSGDRRDRGVVRRGPRPAPRRQAALNPDQGDVRRDRHQHQRHRPEQGLGEEAVAVALEDEE